MKSQKQKPYKLTTIEQWKQRKNKQSCQRKLIVRHLIMNRRYMRWRLNLMLSLLLAGCGKDYVNDPILVECRKPKVPAALMKKPESSNYLQNLDSFLFPILEEQKKQGTTPK